MQRTRDDDILESIFNPFLPLGENLSLPHEELAYSQADDSEDFLDIEEAKRLEIEGVSYAEKGNLEEAEKVFNIVTKRFPRYASAYNNRAQVYRLLKKENEALCDLNRAVELSASSSKIRKLALCQRGILHMKNGRENEARKDFQSAADLGSQFAKQLLVQLNPYAALCNMMLHDVLRAEIQ